MQPARRGNCQTMMRMPVARPWIEFVSREAGWAMGAVGAASHRAVRAGALPCPHSRP